MIASLREAVRSAPGVLSEPEPLGLFHARISKLVELTTSIYREPRAAGIETSLPRQEIQLLGKPVPPTLGMEDKAPSTKLLLLRVAGHEGS